MIKSEDCVRLANLLKTNQKRKKKLWVDVKLNVISEEMKGKLEEELRPKFEYFGVCHGRIYDRVWPPSPLGK